MKKFLAILFLLVITVSALPVFSQENQISRKLQEMKGERESAIYQLFSEAKVPDLSFRHNEFVTGQKYFLVNKKITQDILIEKPEILRLQLPINNESVILDLFRKDIFSPTYFLKTSDGRIISEPSTGAFYRGTIEGSDNSIAVVSFLEGELRIMFSDDSDNYRINKTNHGSYVYFKESKLLKKKPFECQIVEEYDGPEKNAGSINSRIVQSGGCVEIYFECDYESYQDNGSSVSDTEDWVAAIFNEVSTLYQNENIPIVISEIFVWTTTDPYAQYSSTSSMLTEFKNQMQANGFNGRLAHLLSTRGVGGGIAYLNVLCSNTRPCAVSGSLSTNVVPFPTYSWTVKVITHELGHNFGSRHTHACVWNGDNTQVDDCGNVWAENNGYSPEGNACFDSANPILPPNGGTIMSYCQHIGSVGINFNEGFGPEVGPYVYNKFVNASCVTGNCSAPGCTYLTSPIDGEQDVMITTDLEWAEAADATGYNLSIGTTPGGVDILDYEDVGNVTFYDPPTDFPCASDIYVTITPYNTSGEASDCLEESFSTESVDVDAGPDGFMCEGGLVQLEATGGFFYSWTPSTGLSNPNIANPIASPEVTTTYFVTATSINGCEGVDEVVVTVYSLPPADAGPDAEICTGGSIQFQASGGVLYSWSPATGLSDPSISNPIASPEVTTTYTVLVLDENGCENTDDITITVYSSPSPTISGDLEICEGNASTLVASSGYADYLWNTGANTQQIAAITEGIYSVTVTDANGCEGSDTVELIVHPSPVASAGEDAEMCPDELVQLQATGGTSYTWAPTTGLNNPNIADPIASPMVTTTYVVTAFDANGCTDSDSVEVIVHADLLSDAGVDQTIPNGASTTLTGNASQGSGNFSYMWSPANLLTNPNVQNPTTINLFASQVFTLDVVDNETGCTGTDEVTIIVSGDPLEVFLSAGSMSVCEGKSTQLFAAPTGGSGNYSYNWTSDPVGFISTLADPIVSPIVTTTYFITINDGFNTVTNSIQIVVNPAPIANLPQLVSICYGMSVTICAEEVPDASYLWNTGEVDPCITVSPTTSTTFIVTLTLRQAQGDPGCSASDTVEVEVGPELIFSLDKTDETEVGAGDGSAWPVISGGVPPYNFLWSNNSTDSLISNLTPGTYGLTVTDQMGCQATGSVIINPGDCGELTINSTVIHPLCYGDCAGSISIESIDGGTEPFEFNWSNGNTTSAMTDLCDVTYDLTITDANQCQEIVSFTIIEPNELVVDLLADSSIIVSGGTTPMQDTVYTFINNWYYVDVTDANGCIATDSIFIVAVEEEIADIPISVYPNPVREKLYLDYPSDVVLERIELVDIYGRVVTAHYNLNNREIDVRGIVEGYYLLLIDGKGIQMVVPVVIVR